MRSAAARPFSALSPASVERPLEGATLLFAVDERDDFEVPEREDVEVPSPDQIAENKAKWGYDG